LSILPRREPRLDERAGRQARGQVTSDAGRRQRLAGVWEVHDLNNLAIAKRGQVGGSPCLLAVRRGHPHDDDDLVTSSYDIDDLDVV
jgi:hypothetical protein